MKLIEVKREYGLNQHTFYGWLKENRLIVKEMSGYVIGPNALEGMQTSTNRRINGDGEILINTQVVIDNQKIPQLLERYEASGLPRLYSPQKQSRGSDFEGLAELEKRVAILEKQLYISTDQLTAFIEQNSRGRS